MNENMRQRALLMLASGLGKKAIAQELGTTEWQVRKVAQDLVDDEPEYEEPVDEDEYVPRHPVLKIPTKGRVTVAFVSDVHVPFEDKEAVDVTLQILEDVAPDIVILGGDIMDCYAISKYPKDPKKMLNFQEEVDATKVFIDDVMKVSKKAKEVYFMEGNHELRCVKYLRDKAPEIAHIENMTIPSLLDLKSRGIHYTDSSIIIGKLMYIHGRKISKHSAFAAKGNLDDMGISVIAGHGHRIGVHYRTNWGGEFAAIENGTLARIDQEYMEGNLPNWQQGITLIEYLNNDFWIDQIHIQAGKAVVRGKLYESSYQND